MATIFTGKPTPPRPKKEPPKVPNVKAIYGLGDVAVGMNPDHYYLSGTTPMVSPELILGLELELEGFPRNEDNAVVGFIYDTDGSLRNNGRECITAPTKAKYLERLLSGFFQTHRITPANYTDRTSTHVHMNAQDMTIDQVKNLALVYQTVERLLFDFVGHERDENIYCVPWYTAGVTVNLVNKFKSPKTVTATWLKYTALNLAPLTTQGTVEFRHLHGTCDVPLILNWINLIACLRKYSTEHTYEQTAKSIMDMNTVSNYDAFLERVFGERVPLLVKDNYKELLSIGVLDSKLMLANKKEDKATWLEQMREANELIAERRLGLRPNPAERPARNPGQQAIPQVPPWPPIPRAREIVNYGGGPGGEWQVVREPDGRVAVLHGDQMMPVNPVDIDFPMDRQNDPFEEAYEGEVR